jgi:endoglucanase
MATIDTGYVQGLNAGKLPHADVHNLLHARYNADQLEHADTGTHRIPQLTDLIKDHRKPMRGLNIAGAEFGTVGDAYGTTWAHESQASFDFLAGRGWRLVRYAIKWERLQPTLSGAFDAAELARVVTAVARMRSAGMWCILNLHNMGKFNGISFGTASGPMQADFVDFWSRMSDLFREDSTVIGYGLMNEPTALLIGGETGLARWQLYSQAVVDALRAKNDRTCLLISGWSAASLDGWFSGTNTPLPWITDPFNNFRYEAHDYWDSSATGGTYTKTFADEDIFNVSYGGSNPTERHRITALRNWVNWLRRYDLRGFIGEFGWLRSDTGANAADSPLWDALAEKWLDICDSAGDRLWWTCWATGSKWSTTYTLAAYGPGGGATLSTLRNQAVVLERHLEPGQNWSPDVYLPGPKLSDLVVSSTYWRGSSYDPAIIASAQAVPLGQPLYCEMWLEEDGPLSNLIAFVNVSVVTPTSGQCLAAIYDEGGNQLAVSGDIGALLIQTAYKSLPMTTPTKDLKRGTVLWGGLLVNAATSCQIGRYATLAGAIMGRRSGLGPTGQTTLPATISPATLTAAGSTFWMGVS